MNILVVNCGSSSLKFQLIDSNTEEVLAKGICERIGIDGRIVYQKGEGEKEVTDSPMPTHKQAIQLVLNALMNEKSGVIKSLDEVGAVGHRVVHGGEKFASSIILNNEVIKGIEECNDLAPLHNPANLIGIHACKELMPGTPMVAVFDTAFHQTMPEKSYMYGLPYKYYDEYKIRRYGFHGTSHSYVSKKAAELLNQPYESMKMIVCHLGNGASICAVENGKSVDTSMGLTPLEGLVMGTRSGDIDPAIIEFIAQKEGLDITSIMNILNKESGVYGISGVSSDFRDLESAAANGDERAARALEIFRYRVLKYIGSYIAALNGVDAICFTAGLGENDPVLRSTVCNNLAYLGIEIDKEANSVRGKDIVISTPDSKVKVLVIPTNEELAIARETLALVK
ncbi:acetate/propionate family kinase [Anaerosacchariphilus polymeriproducens]|uniref:Acetate kinase n=1 Tax=Anaerosacchariphilus polymeriproducens TaxID=1812858 RepID=A0A371ATM4_9FIRM|nr:acetate kinase [Anaerosacchariphilus polymeriproducens]RDU22901.1 acetate kinase [Anaerosacchariphilus polymeriproducens]